MFEDFLTHKCDLYHLKKEEGELEYGLKAETRFSYGDSPDEKNVRCHFGLADGNITVIQTEAFHRYDARLTLTLPFDTNIRANDKVIDCETGYQYLAGIPIKIREHHISVELQRTEQEGAL